MKIQSLLLVAAAALIAVGCAPLETAERSYSFRASYPVGGKPMMPFVPSGNPVPCPGGQETDSCTIPIKVTEPCDAAGITLADFVKLGALAEKKRVTWKLPLGYYFCQRAGDGVFLKDPNAPDDLFDPVDNPKCSDSFEWKRKKSDSNDYEYLIRFRSATKVCGVKDPWARN